MTSSSGNMEVRIVDLEAQNEPLHEELLAALDRVIRSQSFILGSEVERLERDIASLSEAAFAIGVSSGTDALLVSMMALGVGPGDDVVTTPYSFFSTAGSISRLGARPIFVDIDPRTYNIDPSKIEPAITPLTKAIVPVHLYGQCADMDPILEIARIRGVPIIEDAAQAIGAEYKDHRRAGSMGDLGCLSFYPTKNLGALGDAGMVLTNEVELAEKIRILRVHGASRRYHHRELGGNFRLDSLQAAVLNVKLGYLDAWTRKRRENAERYNALLEASGLGDRPGIKAPLASYEKEDVVDHHVYNQYVIRAPRRDALREYLASRGIGTQVYYPVALHLQECFRDLGHEVGDFPCAEGAASETLALPVYPELTAKQQQTVVEAIGDFYAGKKWE